MSEFKAQAVICGAGIAGVAVAFQLAVDGMAELWDRRTNERTPVALADVVGALTAGR